MEKQAKQENKENKNNKKVIIGIIVLLIALGVAAYSFIANNNSGQGQKSQGIQWDANAEEGGINQRSKEEIQAELNKKVEEGMINISMNTSPVFTDGTSEGNLLIVNSERNNYPQVVYIVIKDTQEEIYRSGAIAVGSKIEKAKLDVDLEPGTYDCVAYFNNVDMETGSFIGTAGAEITVEVKN